MYIRVGTFRRQQDYKVEYKHILKQQLKVIAAITACC